MSSIGYPRRHQDGVAEKVALMRGLSSHLADRRSIERTSGKTFGLLGRKRRAINGMSISDEPSGH